MRVVAYSAGFIVIAGLWALARWAPADDRRNPRHPDQPTRIAAPITLAAMLGALFMVAILSAIAKLLTFAIAFGGLGLITGYYWTRARRWPVATQDQRALAPRPRTPPTPIQKRNRVLLIALLTSAAAAPLINPLGVLWTLVVASAGLILAIYSNIVVARHEGISAWTVFFRRFRQ
jgi:hypothetical protein